VAEKTFWEDVHFQDQLIALLVNDREFLKNASHLLTADDFVKTDAHEGMERRLVAEMALDFWARYREPLGKMLKVELLEKCRKSNWKDETRKRILDYGASLTNGHKRVAADALLERVRQFKMEHRLALALEEMTTMVESGLLTPDRFLAVARKAVDDLGKEVGKPIDLFDEKELEQRIARRIIQRRKQRFPVLLIEPIDRLVRIIARKHMGLVMAPYGRGKTLFFIWLALAYTLQGLNVLHFTLEDPVEDIEDRFDSAITALPLSRLSEVPDRVREKFHRYKKLLRSRLKVVDGTDGAMTIGAMENIWEQERNKGFMADVVIVDYDDEIRPQRKQQERRMEFADIYRDFRAVLARHQLFGWTASQTGRGTSEMKIIRGKNIAEDISKIRKSTFVVSLGQGDWGEESIFLWIEKHRNDIQHVGANIICDKDKMLFYDRDTTLRREKLELAKKNSTTP
jgi:hypothetical protein